MISLLPRLSMPLLCLLVTGAVAEPDGEAVYRTYCAQCHGADLQGSNTAGWYGAPNTAGADGWE